MLEELLKQTKFTESGVAFAETEVLQTLRVYSFMHQAIADNHIPVTKAIGFKLSEETGLSVSVSATERYVSSADNLIEIASNLTDKVFLDNSRDKAAILDCIGRVNIGEVTVVSSMKPVRVFCENPYVFGALKEVTLELFLNENTGFVPMETNVKIIKDRSFFPVATTHSIHKYCMICPPREKGFVEYRLYGGMTAEDVRRYFFALFSQSYNKKLSKEDLEWLSVYEQ